MGYSQHKGEVQARFFTYFDLDHKAQSRLNELSVGKQLVALERFSPNSSVPPRDYPKVFMSYLKNFFEETNVNDESPTSKKKVSNSTLSSKPTSAPRTPH